MVRGAVMATSLTAGRTSRSTTDDELRRVTEDLVSRYPQVPAEQVRTLVERSAGHLHGAKLTEYVPILVQHEVTVALRQHL